MKATRLQASPSPTQILKPTTLTPNPLHSPLSPTTLHLPRLINLLILIESPPSIQINRRSIYPLPIPVIDLRADIQDQHRDDRAIYREKVLHRRLLAQRPYREVELRDDQDDAPRQPPPGSPGPSPRSPGEFVGGAALQFPGVAHPDVREADHAPAEEGEEGGEVGEPAEDFGAAWK